MSDLWSRAASIFEFHVADLPPGKQVDLLQFKGKVTLVTNVAEKCGYTPGGYKAYNELHSKYKDQGFAVLAFPSNEFGKQMGDTAACAVKFKAEFPHFGEVKVNGPESSDLFRFLKSKLGVRAVKWNFEKFLCDRDGVPVKHYLSGASKDEIESDIKRLLEKKPSSKL